MGDIIQAFRVRSHGRGPGLQLRLYFDSGTWRTFVKESVAARLGPLMELPEPLVFGGLGNGRFESHTAVAFKIRILEIWCEEIGYVVADHVLEDRYDILIGHGFMQGYDIRLRPKRHTILADRSALKMPSRVR
ncbi:MAG: hypothetical protein HYY17_11960 [Planctomycetes bacterium]|nr:hypothetical protein [Planctomycetota bacterium]